MILKELIETLEKYPQSQQVKIGFNNPHSYRGYYERLAFEPCHNTTVGDMLTAARSANGATYQGWKGGMYLMDDYSDCYLSEVGRTGEEIGPTLLKLMLENGNS